ncbi:MAG: heme exporter protein CcmD [Candidatus Hermodarchaeota archaeon]
MSTLYFDRDLITLSVSYILFWAVILILILYPILQLRKIMKRIKRLEKNGK